MTDLDHARALFEEYAAQLGVDLCFQNFGHELATLPGEYAPPRGRLHVAFESGEAAACVALRPLSEAVCELKRLYVRPEFRGRGLGKTLVDLMAREGSKIGYTALRLDTLPSMYEAIALYRGMGFQEISPYRHNPVPGSRFFELDLSTLRADL